MKRTYGNYISGLRAGLPIGLGYLPVSFAFGIFAMESGLSGWEAVLISFLDLTSAGQFAAVPLIAGGASLVELALTQLVINIRYALMSVSLSQKLGDDVRTRDRFAVSFFVTDEVFAVASVREGNLPRAYLYGIGVAPLAGWTCGTFLGVLAGSLLPASVTSALGVALYAMFVAIVFPAALGEWPIALCAAFAACLSCAFRYIPLLRANVSDGFALILSAIAAAALAAWIRPVREEATV